MHGNQNHRGSGVTYERGRVGMTADRPVREQPRGLVLHQPVSAICAQPATSSAPVVLEHQTRVVNLIIRLGYETRIALHDGAEVEPKIRNTVEELLRYMLFTDEALLEEPVNRTSGFAEAFEAQGRRIRKAARCMSWTCRPGCCGIRCSYLIDSEAFEALPDVAKHMVYQRLWEVLSGKDESDVFATLSAAEPQAILAILRDTKTDLPSYWR